MATKTFILTVMLSLWVINIGNVTICMQCHMFDTQLQVIYHNIIVQNSYINVSETVVV